MLLSRLLSACAAGAASPAASTAARTGVDRLIRAGSHPGRAWVGRAGSARPLRLVIGESHRFELRNQPPSGDLVECHLDTRCGGGWYPVTIHNGVVDENQR